MNYTNDKSLGLYKFFSVFVMFILLSVIIFFIIYYANFNIKTEPVSKGETISGEKTEVAVTSEPQVAPPIITEPAVVEPYIPNADLVAFTPSTPLEILYPNTVLRETTDAGQDYIDGITFLGDSTTYGLIPYKMLKDGRDTMQVWTPQSGTLTLSQASIATIVYPDDNSEITIIEAVEKKRPPILLITLGVNGVSFMNRDYFTSEYKKLIESIQSKSPETFIIVQSMFPVARSYAKQESINNEKITAANEWIAALADEAGVKYLDTYSALVGEDGFLPEDYQNGDGMHLNDVGFGVELSYIRTHAAIDYTDYNTNPSLKLY
jgi:lysophospholipase L1-like esterase